MSKNRWELDDGIKEKVKTMVTDYITNCEVTEKLDLSELPGVGPYHVRTILEELGYEEIDTLNAGWEMAYWFHFEHFDDDKFSPLFLFGTAIIHEMYLRKEEN